MGMFCPHSSAQSKKRLLHEATHTANPLLPSGAPCPTRCARGGQGDAGQQPGHVQGAAQDGGGGGGGAPGHRRAQRTLPLPGAPLRGCTLSCSACPHQALVRCQCVNCERMCRHAQGRPCTGGRSKPCERPWLACLASLIRAVHAVRQPSATRLLGMVQHTIQLPHYKIFALTFNAGSAELCGSIVARAQPVSGGC